MLEITDYWLILEPFVQVVFKGNQALFYNTLSKTTLVISTDSITGKLIRHLVKKVNARVILLTENELKKPLVKEMIRKLSNSFMIEILPVYLSKQKPVNLIPEPVIKYGLINKKPGLKEYLFELNLHLSDILLSDPFPSNGFRQFLYPRIAGKKLEYMDVGMIQSILNQLTPLEKLKINLLGGDFLKIPEWHSIFELFNKSYFSIHYHILVPGCDPIFPETLNKQSKLVYILNRPYGKKNHSAIMNIMARCDKKRKPEFNFIVENNEDVKHVSKIIRELQLDKAYFKPYFNGMNLSFFKENVFINLEDIFSSKPDQNQIFSRKLVNENDFGKLSILPDGTVFANINDPPLGDLKQFSLIQMIAKELHHGVSWKRVRPKVLPCKNCIYHWLCPPISNYEIFMEKYNFCYLCQ